MARLDHIRTISEADVDVVAKGAIQFIIDEATVFVAVAELIDLAAEKIRLDKEILKQHKEIGRFEKSSRMRAFLIKPLNQSLTESAKNSQALKRHLHGYEKPIREFSK